MFPQSPRITGFYERASIGESGCHPLSRKTVILDPLQPQLPTLEERPEGIRAISSIARHDSRPRLPAEDDRILIE